MNGLCPQLMTYQWRVVAALLLFVAIASPGLAVRKHPKKRCTPLCREVLGRCRDAIAAASACGLQSGAARRACKRRQRKEQRGCRTRLVRACKADPVSDRCVASDGAAGEPTAWETLLARIESGEEVTLETARQAFSLLIAPLPGVELPPGAVAGSAAAFGRDSGEVGGCAAVRWITAYREQLTPEQMQAVDAALAVPTVPLARAHATFTAVPAEVLDDAADLTRFRQLVADAAAAIGAKLGRPLTLPIEVVFKDPAKPGAAAALQPESAPGDPTKAASCVMFVPARTRTNPDATSVRGVITHEVFHCFQAQIAGLTRYSNLAAPMWLDEGGPNWVSADLVGFYPGIDTSWVAWFEQPTIPLATRAYSGLGIFAEAQWLGADVYALFPTLMAASTHPAAFGVLTGGIAAPLSRSWASSLYRVSSRSREWDVMGNGVPPYQVTPTFVSLPEGGIELVDVKAYAAEAYRVPAAAPNVLINVAGGTVRIGDAIGRDIAAPAGTLLCTASPCQCPDGSPPPGITLDVLPPLDVAITGWTTGATGSLEGLSIEDRCKRDPNDPTGFCRSLQPLLTLGPVLADAILNGSPADLRAAWGPWKDTLVNAGPVPATIAAAWGGVVNLYGTIATAYYEAIDYDVVDALVCDEGESAEECASEITRSEIYADEVVQHTAALLDADAYTRSVCNVSLALDFGGAF